MSLQWPNPLRWKNKETPNPAAATKSTSENLPYGIKVLAEGIDPSLDIVAVHGFNGHREKTWMANDANWLRDFLPSDIPHARILTWGYDANTQSVSKNSAQSLYDHARTLVSDLYLKRRLTNTQKRPLVFVAHSLGGIVVKSALIYSDAARQGALEEHRSIKLSTYGLFFMGTPHQGGSGVHLGQLMLKVASIFVQANDKIVKHLERDSEWLQQQLSQYGPISRDFVTKFAYEMFPTTVALGKTIMIVPQASATIPGIANAEPIAIPADHLNMVKFVSREDAGYEKVSGYLQILAEEAPGAIDARWTEQDRIRDVLSNTNEDFSVSFSLSGIPEIENLVGREEELARIKEAFQGNGSHRVTVLLQGLGGIGKTQLSATFLKEQRDLYSAIFWLNGRNEDMLKQSFANMAERLHDKYPSSTLLRPAAESKDLDLVVRVMKRWLSAKGNTRWILVFDNIDTPKLPGVKDPQAYDIKSYFPEVHQGFILITTRSSRLRLGKVISVKKLHNVQDSITVLADNSQRQISDQDSHAKELAKMLDGLPLALATAGAYLSQVSTSLTDYLRYYNSSWLRLQETTPELPSYEDRALYSTWNISYEHICSQNESAGKLLKLWAYFDNQDLWYTLLMGGSEFSPAWFSNIIGNELSFNEVIRVLCDHALIESHGELGGYSMHGCVHAWTMNVLNSERDVSMANLALSCVSSAVPDEHDLEYWASQRRLLPHANRCLESISSDSILAKHENYVLDAFHSLGALYLDQKKLKEAEQMYLRVLTGCKNTLGPKHSSTLATINNLGALYSNQGRMQEAEDMYLEALAGYKNTRDPDHTSTLSTLHNLGTLYLVQGRMKEAEDLFLQALAGKENALGSDHTSTLNTVNSLGYLYSDQDMMKEAEQMYLRALTGQETTWGPEHTSTLDTVNNLATLYKKQGKMKEAEDKYLRALAGYRNTWGPEHTSTLNTISNLGNLYLDQGKMQEAEDMYLQALAGKENTWGPEHTSTLDTVDSLGNLYLNQGKMKKAEDMFLRALAGYDNTWGPGHKSTLNTVNNLGNLYREQCKMKEAEQFYLRALAGYETICGPEHTSTLNIVHNLGTLYSDQGMMKEAEDMYLRALRGREATWGPEHTSTLDTVNNLGILYSDQGKMQEAEDMYLRALAGKENTWGPEHTSTLSTVSNLGSLYLVQGKMKEAEDLYLRALRGYKNTRGPDHTSMLRTAHSLGSLYLVQGKMQKAEDMYLRALEGKETTLGPEHTSTLNTVHKLGDLYSEQGRMQEAEDMYLRTLAGYEKTRGPKHTSTLDTVNSLGNLYRVQGKTKEAEQLYLRALLECENTCGPAHLLTLSTVNNLGTLYKVQGKMKEAQDMYLRALVGYEKARGLEYKHTLDTRYNLAVVYRGQSLFEDAKKHFKLVVQGCTNTLGPEHKETIDAIEQLETLQT